MLNVQLKNSQGQLIDEGKLNIMQGAGEISVQL